MGVPVKLPGRGPPRVSAGPIPPPRRFPMGRTQATWRNAAEQGSNATAGFYITFDGVPEEAAVLARALLAARGGMLPLLPEGEARIAKVGELAVQANGRTRTVVQYAISGLGFTPSPIWLDANGDFFAAGSTWFMA